MNHLTLPKLLNIPDKLIPLIEHFEKYRYFLIKGGRGGAKSQSIGRFILYLSGMYNLRTVCGRETQNSINESVYSLMADLIREFQLDFEIQASKIISNAKTTEINFRGFREQGAFNIQGMEGIDLVWIDEAQALKKATLDVLIPTIRKETAKVIFSMNPHVFDDPVVVQFSNRDDCLVIDLNYTDNPFCSNALIKEAEECQKRSEKDYRHIWLGEPLEQGDDCLFALSDFENGTVNAHILSPGYGLRVAGFDIARFGGDTSGVVVFQQMGALHWEEVFCDEWAKTDLNYTTGRILAITNEQKIDLAAIDEDGIGAGPFDTLTRGRQLDYFVGFRNPTIAYKDNKTFVNPRTINAYKVKDMLVAGHLNIKTQKIKNELLTLRYTFDHQQRRILISKEKMKKDGVPSPNLADSAIMAASLIGKVKEKQDRQYEANNQQTYGAEESLFKIAGIN